MIAMDQKAGKTEEAPQRTPRRLGGLILKIAGGLAVVTAVLLGGLVFLSMFVCG